jgi:hypothetical protein
MYDNVIIGIHTLLAGQPLINAGAYGPQECDKDKSGNNPLDIILHVY